MFFAPCGRCEVLKQQPFSACHLVVDPEPYISACSSSLCRYPSVDGFNCDLLEAYSRACSMHRVQVEDWRTQTKCAETHATCQEMYCSEHEFCGEKHNGWESGWGPTRCRGLGATLTMATCLLEERGVDYNTLHMNDQSCVGRVDNVTHMVTFSFDEINTCGSVVKSNGSNIIYENSIKTQNSSNFGIITRHEDAQVQLSCHIEQPDTQSVGIRVKDSSVMMEMESGEWKYNLTMTVFMDEDHKKLLTSDMEIEVDQRLYLELAADGLDEKLLSLVLDSCWATPEPSPKSSLKYGIVGGGCPNPQDKSVTITNNGEGLSVDLSFSMFQFTSRSGNVYLHCQATLCVNEEGPCAPVVSTQQSEAVVVFVCLPLV
uniref:ZP domain-containing protein n=1 Tax=Knipowitschia caucasica TaxID=637954 RepID=A0AAV2JZX2_KNICA